MGLIGRAACAALAFVLAMPLHAQTPATQPSVDVDLAAEHDRHADRVRAAAVESLEQYRAWLGPLTHAAIVLTDRAGAATSADKAAVVSIDLPWHAPQAAMEVEAHVAFAIARLYWPHAPEDAAIADGLSWYLQSRIVERLFNLAYARPGCCALSLRLFGGHISWPLQSLHGTRWGAGLARGALLAASAPASRAGGRRLPPGVTAAAIRSALAFASLERLLGWPALQGALAALARTTVERPLTAHSAAAVIGAAAGRDLTWFFDVAFDPAVVIDYGATEVVSAPSSEPCAAQPCFHTSVTLARNGGGRFTGTSRAPIGPYRTGRALAARVTFADGQTITPLWDGRDQSRTFRLESSAPATSVQLAPDGVLLLDPTPLDHTRTTSPGTNVPVVKWMARWVMWLQDAMLAAVSVT